MISRDTLLVHRVRNVVSHLDHARRIRIETGPSHAIGLRAMVVGIIEALLNPLT